LLCEKRLRSGAFPPRRTCLFVAFPGDRSWSRGTAIPILSATCAPRLEPRTSPPPHELKTSPSLPQRSSGKSGEWGARWNEGVFSEWNGHRREILPVFFNAGIRRRCGQFRLAALRDPRMFRLPPRQTSSRIGEVLALGRQPTTHEAFPNWGAVAVHKRGPTMVAVSYGGKSAGKTGVIAKKGRAPSGRRLESDL